MGALCPDNVSNFVRLESTCLLATHIAPVGNERLRVFSKSDGNNNSNARRIQRLPMKLPKPFLFAAAAPIVTIIDAPVSPCAACHKFDQEKFEERMLKVQMRMRWK